MLIEVERKRDMKGGDLFTSLTCVGKGVANDTDEGDTWIPLAPFLKEDLLNGGTPLLHTTHDDPEITSSRNMLRTFYSFLREDAMRTAR
jgi:hypothetical protein